MVTLSKLYTGNGDQGKTHLVGGTLTEKHNIRVAAYGDLDEVNAHFGLLRTITAPTFQELSDWIARIQNDLFDIGAIVASPPGSNHQSLPTIDESHVSQIEQWIDSLVEPLPTLQSFVLPGGSEANAHFHIARTVCRRAERTLCALADAEEVPDAVVIYVNRLSDFLFAAARSVIHQEKHKEFLWIPGNKK